MERFNVIFGAAFFMAIVLSADVLVADADSTTNTAADRYEGLVILEVENMTDDIYAKIQARIGKSNSTNLEYGCAENDIIVVKFLDSSFSGKADNAKMIENILSRELKDMTVNRIFMKVRPYKGMSKC